MTEVHLAHFAYGDAPGDGRNRIHEIALREARATTDYREPQRTIGPRPSIAARLRLAVGGGPLAITEPCNCPA